MTLEQRIINIAEKQNYYDSRELRAIALEVRKREDRIKQLEEENGAMRADLLLWKYQLEEERGNASKEPIQSDSSMWNKAGIGFTTEDKP